MNDQTTKTTDPTPRERGRKTCRAALMSVISLHRRTDPLAAEVDGQLAQAVVAAVVAMMDLDGLRGDIDAPAAGRLSLAELAKRRPSKSDRMMQVLGEGFTLSADTAVELNEAMTQGDKLVVALRAAASHRERVQELEAGVQGALEKLDAVAGQALGYAADGQRSAVGILRGVL